MQLIVTCAGCGAKYRGESGPKKFRCAACSNLFTFPEQPKSASAGTILCSNCWTETVPTEKLKTCGFCSQRVSPRYGGLAAEDKQVKVKQPSVRNDPNLVKAVTRPDQSSSEISAGGITSSEPKSNQFASSEWKEIGGENKSGMHDPTKTQAFELMAELKKEIEPEMQSVVESIMKSQKIDLEKQRQNESALHGQGHGHGQGDEPRPHGSQTGMVAADAHGAGGTQSTPETQSHSRETLEAGNLDARHAKDAPRESRSQDDAVRELQAKVAELTALVTTDKRAREQLLQDRVQLEELWRERDAKVAELTARLNSDAAARTDFDARLNSERQAKEALQRERDHWFEAHKDLDTKFADLSTRMASDRNVRETAFKTRDELADARQELETRITDLEARLTNEKKSKESLIRERDQLSDGQRELQARIADLESRLQSERSEKENIALKHDRHLEAKNDLDAKVADLESRLNSEREAKDAAIAEREKLHQARLELEARSADLGRRHANEREAKERILKEHGDMSNEHRELSAKIADFKTRLKAEQDIKENVRNERDAALARADQADSRVEKSEAEVLRLRKGINTQLDKFAAEYNAILARLAERTAELSTHAAVTRKHLQEAAQHHGDKVETGVSELKSKLEHESIEIGTRLKKLMQEPDHRDSARLAAQSGSHPPLPPRSALRTSCHQ